MKTRLDARAEVGFYGYEDEVSFRTFGISVYFQGEELAFDYENVLGRQRQLIHFQVRDAVQDAQTP